MARGPLLVGDPDHVAGYRLEARIGQGGQGVVFLGRDRTGRAVAVKLLHPTMLGDSVARARFAKELAAIRKVARFCTAQVLDADTEGDRPYIVSEFVDGPSLAVEVARTGPRRGAELDRLAIGTATALVAIHQAGVVHCDFKPANVLLAQDGPRVIDFGIARALDVSGTVSEVIGTPAFMAPEQITRTDVRAATDVFAWAATIAFAVNGASPFAGRSSVESMYRVLEDPPDLGGMDGSLRTVVERCLAKDPADRPGSRELLLDLLAVLGSAGEHTVPIAEAGPTERLRTEQVLDLGATRASTRLDPPVHPTATPAAGRPRRTRLLVAAALAAALVVATVVALVVFLPTLTGAPTATSIPAEFAGRWTGSGRLPKEGTTAHPRLELVAGSRITDIEAGESGCASGNLRFRSASTTHMEMDYVPSAPDRCPGGIMSFDLDGSTLRMHLGDEATTYYYATLTR
ncbi:serine/threonine-protein kinase [Pseudonocardia sp. CA-107938]|uniref:serine/threonine-protein kinase n=1 Tax=Pseudonocardia sp. CA-107938 TaxID=3240021 RepID=UPI003D8DA88A